MEHWQSLALDEIPEWPKTAQNKLLALVFLLVTFVALLFYIFVYQSQMSEAQAKEQELKNQYKQKREKLHHLFVMEQKIKQMQLLYQEMEQLSLAKAQLAQFFESIDALGQDHQLALQRLDWHQGKQHADFYSLPISLEVSGQFQHFGAFSAAISRLPKLINLQKIIVKKEHGILRFFITAQAYDFTQPREMP